jgi:hypothetical protein
MILCKVGTEVKIHAGAAWDRFNARQTSEMGPHDLLFIERKLCLIALALRGKYLGIVLRNVTVSPTMSLAYCILPHLLNSKL